MFKHTTSFAPELSIVITCTSLSIFIQTNITSEIHHKCNIYSVKQVEQNAGDSIKFYAELNPKPGVSSQMSGSLSKQPKARLFTGYPCFPAVWCIVSCSQTLYLTATLGKCLGTMVYQTRSAGMQK